MLRCEDRGTFFLLQEKNAGDIAGGAQYLRRGAGSPGSRRIRLRGRAVSLMIVDVDTHIPTHRGELPKGDRHSDEGVGAGVREEE